MNDGGQAFPGIVGAYSRGNFTIKNGPTGIIEQIEHAPGISIRDYFAGKALIRLANDAGGMSEPILWNWGKIAKAAYMAADAMLAERSKL
jgi:hypothetical protein